MLHLALAFHRTISLKVFMALGIEVFIVIGKCPCGYDPLQLVCLNLNFEKTSLSIVISFIGCMGT